MQTHPISGLNQAEDRELDFAVTIDSQPVVDVAKALFVVQDLTGKELFRYTLTTGVTFANSTFTVALTDADTASLVGKYSYELWFRDSQNNETLAFKGTLKFDATFGRFQ